MWKLGEAIAVEIDLALEVVLGRSLIAGGAPDYLQSLLDNTPPDWIEQMAGWDDRDTLENAAHLAGVLESDDYETVTRAIREMTLTEATDRLHSLADRAEIPYPHDIADPITYFIELGARVYARPYEHLVPEGLYRHGLPHHQRADFAMLARVLRDGVLGERFWQGLDRFYYETYTPWRETRQDYIIAQHKRAVTGLGAETGDQPPPIEWLPPKNGIQHLPPVRSSIEDGSLNVYFCNEPVGVTDLVSIYPDNQVLLSFGGTDELETSFIDFATRLATQLKPLSDPKRLVILRMIRNFGMTNTEIAEYLDISRSSVSAHARVLREAGLIRSRPDGRSARHEVNKTHIRELLTELETLLDLPED